MKVIISDKHFFKSVRIPDRSEYDRSMREVMLEAAEDDNELFK